MKLYMPSIVWALATTVCLGKTTKNADSAMATEALPKDARRKQRVGRDLSFAYLVNHKVSNIDPKLGAPQLRAEIATENIPIVGEMYQTDITNTVSRGSKGGNGGGNGGNNSGNNSGNGGGNGRNGGGGGGGKGAKGDGSNKRNNNNNNKKTGNDNLNKQNRNQQNIGTCQDICLGSDSPAQSVCNADSVMAWKEMASSNCCCSKGVSYLKLEFSTMFYENNDITGSFSVDTTSSRNGNGRNQGSAANVRLVDCFDICLTDPLANNECQSVIDTQENVIDGSAICIAQIDPMTNKPLFDEKFPTNLSISFSSSTGDKFTSNIHTSCSYPVNFPWASVAVPDGVETLTSPINIVQGQEGLNYPVFIYWGGISAGYYEAAMNDPMNEAGFQLDLEQCGCDCSQTFRPSVSRNSVGATTFSPTNDISCSPTTLPKVQKQLIIPTSSPIPTALPVPTSSPVPTDLPRTAAPITNIEADTKPPSPSPSSSPTNDSTDAPTTVSPTAKPSASPTDASDPTIHPTCEHPDSLAPTSLNSDARAVVPNGPLATVSPTGAPVVPVVVDTASPTSLNTDARVGTPNGPSGAKPSGADTASPTSPAPTARTGAPNEPAGVGTQPPTFLTVPPTDPITDAPTAPPSDAPTAPPTDAPTAPPIVAPTAPPIVAPTAPPTVAPITNAPTASPSDAPSTHPTCEKDKVNGPKGPKIKKTKSEDDLPEGPGAQGNSCGIKGEKSIYDYICSLNNFSNMCAMIQKAELQDIFSGLDDAFDFITIFAPTNQGCEISGLSLDDINAMDKNVLRQIVMTHATAGSIRAEDLQCEEALSTLEGTYSVHHTKCYEDSHAKAQFGFFNDEANMPMILSPNDLELCNGMLQPVNHMIRVISY